MDAQFTSCDLREVTKPHDLELKLNHVVGVRLQSLESSKNEMDVDGQVDRQLVYVYIEPHASFECLQRNCLISNLPSGGVAIYPSSGQHSGSYCVKQAWRRCYQLRHAFVVQFLPRIAYYGLLQGVEREARRSVRRRGAVGISVLLL